MEEAVEGSHERSGDSKGMTVRGNDCLVSYSYRLAVLASRNCLIQRLSNAEPYWQVQAGLKGFARD